VRGSSSGTIVSSQPLEHEVTLAGEPMEIMLFATGMLAPDASHDALTCDGDLEIARRLPALFDFSPAQAADVPTRAGDTTRPIPPAEASESPRPARSGRRASRPAAARGRYKTVSIPTGGDPS
jgi:hypothetical protein